MTRVRGADSMEPNLTASVVIHDSSREEVISVGRCLLAAPLRRVDFIYNGSGGMECPPEIASDERVVWCHVANNGFGSGHNIAMRKNCEDFPEGFHLVVNADTHWSPGVIERLASEMAADTTLGMIAPKVILPDGTPQLNRRRLPSPLDLLARRFNPLGIFNRRLDRFLMRDKTADEVTEAPYLLGCFFMVRNRALQDCGFFDENFFLYPEDLDLTRRIHERWKTLYWPYVTVIHRHDAASRHSLRMLVIHVVNMAKYFYKWRKKK